MLIKRPHEYTIVHNDSLFFISRNAFGETQVVHHLPIALLLESAEKPPVLPTDCPFTKNTLLIVPDYWVGSTVYQLQSKKEAVVHAFIERKLRSDHPDLSDIPLFFNYMRLGGGDLFVYFLLDLRCFKLYHRLAAMGLAPLRITTPAFLWIRKLEGRIPDFDQAGCCLVHQTDSASFLYFFSNGQFLFSRSISFPATSGHSSDRLDALAYEINQSVFLFSQKAKRELNLILMATANPEDIASFSGRLDRRIEPLPIHDETILKNRDHLNSVSPMSAFSPEDLSPSGNFLYISHKLEQKTLEWKPVQLAGMAAGALLLGLLSIETIFLWKWPAINLNQRPASITGASADPQSLLYQYSDALDLAITMTGRKSMKEAFFNAVHATPENAVIKAIDIELEPEASVMFKCDIATEDVAVLRNTISEFIGNIDTAFSGVGLVNKQDIKISAVNEKEPGLGYSIEFKLAMP